VSTNAVIYVGGTDIEKSISLFRKQVAKEHILSEAKDRMAYVPPSLKRRKKSSRARARRGDTSNCAYPKRYTPR